MEMERTMNPVLTQLVETGTAVSESGKVHKIIAHIPTEEGFFLKSIVSELKPQRSLEVGLAYGVSALFICEALAEIPGARHIVIDPHQLQPTATHMSFEGAGLAGLKRAGYESMIEFHGESSYVALPALASQGTRIDFAFIDGWHTFDYASVDFFYVDLMLRAGGVVVIDDTDFPSVWKLCRYIMSNRAYRVIGCVPAEEPPVVFSRYVIRDAMKRASRVLNRNWYRLTHSDGLVPFSRCIAFRKEENDTRSWDFHREF